MVHLAKGGIISVGQWVQLDHENKDPFGTIGGFALGGCDLGRSDRWCFGGPVRPPLCWVLGFRWLG